MPPKQKPEPILGLELLRGLACLEVLSGHLCLRLNAFTFYPWLQVFCGWGYESVIIFFLLSGFVISRSQMQSKRSQSSYLKARFLRILPLYWIAVLLSIGTDYLLDPRLRPLDIAGVLLFLQTQPGEDLTLRLFTNTPLWSLSHEMWFYLIFTLTIGPNQRTALYRWAFLGACASLAFLLRVQPPGLLGHFCLILAMSPVWLAGVALSYAKLPLRFSAAQAMAFLGLIPALESPSWQPEALASAHAILLGVLMFPLFAIASGQNGPSSSRLTSGLIWFTIILLEVGLSIDRHLHEPDFSPILYQTFGALALATAGKWVEASFSPSFKWSPSLRAAILYLGAISYAVYIIHSPFINGLGLLSIGKYSAFWYVVIPAIIITATVMEKIVQPAAKQLITRT